MEKDDTTGGCGSEGREKDEREDRSNSESPRQNVRPDRGGGGQRGGGREIKRFERREGRVEGEERNERDVASRQEIAEDRGIDRRRRREKKMRGVDERWGGEEGEGESGGSGRTRLYYTNGRRDPATRPASDDVVLTTRTFSRTYSYSFSFLAYTAVSFLV